jgi:hypothetical protein
MIAYINPGNKNDKLENYGHEISFKEMYCDMTPKCQNPGVRKMSETSVTGR